MKRRRFLVNVIYDAEYKGYAVDVPQLTGCMSQGKTVETALANIREAIAAYLPQSANYSNRGAVAAVCDRRSFRRS